MGEVSSMMTIDDARVIHHLRSLDMPVEEIHRALQAPNEIAKNGIIADHLRRMEQRLAQTQSSVESLRRLLTAERPAVRIDRRHTPASTVLVIRDTIGLNDLGAWFTAANAELDDATRSDLTARGPRGGLWSTELFLDEWGDCALFQPVSAGNVAPADTRAAIEVLPATRLAVATHEGEDSTIGEVYAELGTYVTAHGISAPGPVRESYLSGTPRQNGTTEIGWPIKG